MSVLTNNMLTGVTQFATALKNSQNNVSALLRQAGIVMPGGGAASGLGGAFDPANLVAGETLSPEQIASMTAGTSYGAEGAYSEAYQAGGNIAADQAMQSRSRGLGGGGLASQRQELALMQTQGGVADVTQALLTGLGEQYGNVNQAYANEKQRIIDEQTKAADEAAAIGSVTKDPVADTRPTIKNAEIRGTYYRGSREERVKSLRGLIASHTLTPYQQKEVQRLLKQSGFKWDIPSNV